jgi:hypothetical protein
VNIKTVELARKYYDSVVDCIDYYQTSRMKFYRERAIIEGALSEETARALMFKADQYLIKNRERILDDLAEFFNWEMESFLHLENYIYAIKKPLQMI